MRYDTTDEEYAARFWSRVGRDESEDGCWPWMGRLAPNGYGRFHYRGRDMSAHVMALKFDGRPVPKGGVGMHSCDNPPCCRPSHLWPGTQADNRRDCAEKGRTAKGERNGVPRRLTPDQVRAIRSSVKVQTVVASEFGISQPMVSEIRSGKKYAWVPDVDGDPRARLSSPVEPPTRRRT